MNKTCQGDAHRRFLKPAGSFFARQVAPRIKRALTKAATTHADQVALLRQRGVGIDDQDRAAFYLCQINYYRLAAYWLPCEASHAERRVHAGTHFNAMLNVDLFDRELRLPVVDAVERLKLSVRSHWAYELVHRHGPHAHLDQALACDQPR